ncbi:transporter [Vibrio sp. SCSIO 43136]|uniref:transporter n=1 Tax=Vibrio sp. SCSIO 43136 TaxID=2819101 RepID=UPI0020756EA5|nr:transporter [Vibrio sp. SCSIO 43136]
MVHQHSNGITFDYTSFLGASCKKKWTFMEALQSIAPVFGTVWRDQVDELKTPEDKLWEQALNSLSAQCSDESNIARLVELARAQGISQLTVKMPYELDPQQFERIGDKTQCKFEGVGEDDFQVTLL